MEENQNEIQNAVNQALVAEKKKRKKKKWIIIAVVLVVLIIIIAALGGGNDNDTPKVTPANNNSQQAGASTTEAIKDQVITPGNSVSTDTLKITYDSCNANAKDYSKYADVKSGYKVVRADFTFENISSNDQYVGSIQCYADGTKCEGFYSGDDYKNPCLDMISSGRKTTGVVYYEVPASATEIELEIEDDYWKDTHIIFAVS